MFMYGKYVKRILYNQSFTYSCVYNVVYLKRCTKEGLIEEINNFEKIPRDHSPNIFRFFLSHIW